MRLMGRTMGSMRTTIDIPENELAEAMGFLNTRSRHEAVVTALREFNRRHRDGASGAFLRNV